MPRRISLNQLKAQKAGLLRKQMKIVEKKARADERRKIKKEIAQLKREVDQTLLAVAKRGISKSIKDPRNKQRILWAKKRLLKAGKSVKKFVIKFG